ncbi:MAG: T9SS type A sorting domain-containing protein [Flavobacteriales bacterium]|nr:T9SS type A sorting domain-containing protein [Flavobacteriales bacterium]
MQGGTWTTGTPGTHNATYTGTVVYGFSTNPSSPWSATCASPAGNQRSNLPPGMNCFSMSPVSASDFSKYTGPLTIATQRDWIIRLDATSNWSTYGSCGAYNAANPNWLLAPTLPITAGTPVPGLWRGAAASGGTDWFDCKNWDDAVVPTATTDVRIDETANNNCVVGVTAGGTAVCASLVMTNAGTSRNLSVQNGSSLAVGGPITIQRTSLGTAVELGVLGNSTLTGTNLTVQAGTGSLQAVLRNEVPGNTVSFSGDFTINPGGSVDLQGVGVGGTISVAGNYQNQATEAALDDINGTLRFNGIGSQNITTSGFTEVFQNLTVNKSSGSLNLNTNVDLRGTLDLTLGNVNTTATEILTIRAGGTAFATGGLVNGPMVKIGNTNFTFPVGKGTARRPIQVSSIAGSVTDAFRAEYFPVDPSFFGTTGDATLHHISTCEYWTLDRAAGTPNAVVTLYWQAPQSCGVTNLPELRVAQWDDTAIPAPGTWRDRGNGGAAGIPNVGFIPTAAVQSQFNATTTAWTLASTTANNPLPITLLRFTAEPEGNMVRLDWLTASEQDNALFTVERSRDAINFEEVLNVPGALNSSTLLAYSELDRAPYPGLSYYRLRQTDTDGSSTYSNVVSVLFGPVNERPLVVFGTGETWTAVHSFPAGSTYEIVDMTGRRVLGGRTAMEGRTDLYGVVLSRGAYVFRITDGDRVESQRFVY